MRHPTNRKEWGNKFERDVSKHGLGSGEQELLAGKYLTGLHLGHLICPQSLGAVYNIIQVNEAFQGDVFGYIVALLLLAGRPREPFSTR